VIRLYAILLLALAAGVGAVLAFGGDPGYALIHYGPWVVESSALGLVLAVIAVCVVIYVLLRVLGGILSLPQALRALFERRRRKRVRRSFEVGLQHLFEGDWTRAEVELVRRVANQASPHLNYLAAARAAQRLGAYDRRDQYLKLAESDDPEVAAAVLMTRAELSFEQGDHAAARAAAEQLRASVPQHQHAAAVLADSLVALHDWQALLDLAAEADRAGLLTPERRSALRVRAGRGLIAAAVADARLERLKAVWDALAPVRGDIALRRDYLFGLARLNADAEAAAQIESLLDTEWDGVLVQLYGELHSADPIAQLSTVERWLTQYGERPELLRLCGRVCLGARLWGKAQSYLDASLRAEPTPLAHYDLARLYEQTQQPDEAARHHREGLALATMPTLMPPLMPPQSPTLPSP
jgi:HemY protein